MYSSIFQHSLLTYCIPLVKDQSSFYEIRSLAISIKIKAFNRVNRKQLNIVKTFLEYLECLLLLTEDYLALNITYTAQKDEVFH